MIEDKQYIKAHNIIKTIILIKLYKDVEKVKLFRMLELLENTENEFTFIDIVIPTKELIDIATIESLLTKKQVISGMALTIWDYMYEAEINDIHINISVDEKIINLIDTKLYKVKKDKSIGILFGNYENNKINEYSKEELKTFKKK